MRHKHVKIFRAFEANDMNRIRRQDTSRHGETHFWCFLNGSDGPWKEKVDWYVSLALKTAEISSSVSLLDPPIDTVGVEKILELFQLMICSI